MTKLGELYTDFSRIDLDTRGGYARVAQVKILEKDGLPEFGSFKLMRHDLKSPQAGINRFEGELKTLLEITREENYPTAITKIYDSGFAKVELSKSLQRPLEVVENTKRIELVNLESEIISAGADLKKFMNLRSELMKNVSNLWLPYLVVELAPYDDNLLRQIRQLSSGNISDLYQLPVREIISMGLQILDLIDYLHRKHNFAYMDWKPEHIYWNSLKPGLKVIDWNVANRFKNDHERKLIIREDIRVFCGAALYCSLALNDPEDLNLKRPIGPKPETTPNSLFSSEPRYWTDQPIFYDRDIILDDRIKLLIQNALDPKKGYDSPQELRNQLLRYAEQALSLSALDLSPHSISQQRLTEIRSLLDEADDAFARSEYHRSIQLYRRALRIEPNNEKAKIHLNQAESELAKADDTETKLPREAMQLYRSARSYISGKDYQDAIRMLEDAIEIAFKKRVIFREAQQLLDTVKASLEDQKTQQNIKIALEEEQWERALDLYRDAMNLYPENDVFKREFDDLNELLKAHRNVEEGHFRKIFSKLTPLQNLITSTTEFLGSNNTLVKSVEKQIYQIKLIRLGSVIVLLLACVAIFPFFGQGIVSLFPPINPPTITVMPTTPLGDLSTQTSSPTSEITVTIPVTASPTESETPTPTPPLVTLGTGYITFGQVSSWDSPNGKFVARLTQYQVVTILEKTNDHGDDWYRCIWEEDGVTKEGWILAKYIELGPPPTPKP